MNKIIPRGVVVAATVLASLGVLATPASAAVLSGDIIGGTVTLINVAVTITVNIPVPLDVDLGTDCVNDVAITTTVGDPSVANWNITTWRTVQRFKVGGAWFILEEIRTGSTQGTVSMNTLNPATLNLVFNFYLATNQSDASTSCAHGVGRTCRFANVVLTLQGVYNNDIHNPAVSDTAFLDGTGNLGPITPPCGVPFLTFNNGMITVTGLIVHVVNVA